MQVNQVTTVNGTINTTKTNTKIQSDFKSYLGESEELDAIFQKASQTYGVDVNLLKAIAKTESNFKTDATSCAGAQGIMQLMPKTAKALGVNNAYDAEESIMGGAKYISQMLKKYDGDVKLALASYNAGPGNVAKYGGIPPFKETQNYVTKVMKAYNGGSSSATSGSTVSATGNTTAAKTESTADTDRNATISTAVRANLMSSNQSDRITSYVSLLSEYATSSELDQIFSYIDYMNFVESILNEKEDETSDRNEAQQAMELSAAISRQMLFGSGRI